MHLVNFNYNGTVIQRREDGYLNGSQMCFANGKLFADWIRLKSTKAYLDAVSDAMGIPIADLVPVQNGSQTWVHPSVAISLARWISPAFAVWCDAHIFNLMATGSTSLEIDPIREMQLKIELARLENDKAQAELSLVQFRHLVVSTCPEPVQQKVLGYQVIEKTEYRDRIIKDDDVINDGGTVTKTYLCDRYGFKTRNGKPDYRALNGFLSKVGLDNISEAWQMSAYIQETEQLKREYLPELDRRFNEVGRQLFLGE